MHTSPAFSTILTSCRTVKLQHKNCLFCKILSQTTQSQSAHNLLFSCSTGLLWEQEYPLHHLYLSKMRKWTMWHLGEIIIHFPITPCWCDVQHWSIETSFLWPQTSAFCCSNQETVAKRLLLKGPTLGCRCFLWCQYRQQGFFQAMCEWHFQLPHCKVENKLLKWILGCFWLWNNDTISFSVFLKQALGSRQWHNMDRSPVHHWTHSVWQPCTLQRLRHTWTTCICCNVQHKNHWAGIWNE